ncbi:uncharacterized protein VTP21DRAFT_419 [Calcarisporiella thermophila]|uniref:uncharacterized protein n=1 Tax=Calcarisporiella thermophila TaxID=911321 RepID=UPI003742D0F4
MSAPVTTPTNTSPENANDEGVVDQQSQQQDAATPPLPPRQPVNPDIESLRSMFPDLEPEILDAVYLANGKNLEVTIIQLLAMSDENYKPDQTEAERLRVQGQPTSTPQDQLSQDEALARQLFEEENQAARQLRASQRTSSGRLYYGPGGMVVNSGEHAPDGRQPQGEDRIANLNARLQEEIPVIKERINEYAETARKKLRDWYSDLNERFNSTQTSKERTSVRTNAQYTNLPEDDDLLASAGNDLSALRLTDQDVLSQTQQSHSQQRRTIRVEHEDEDEDEPLERRKKASPTLFSDAPGSTGASTNPRLSTDDYHGRHSPFSSRDATQH